METRVSDFFNNDPDLRMAHLGKLAQSHLDNKNVGPGDLFLFFGWFREGEFVNGKYHNRNARSPQNFWLDVCRSKINGGFWNKTIQSRLSQICKSSSCNWSMGAINTIYIAVKSFSLFQKFRWRGLEGSDVWKDTSSSPNAPTKRFWNTRIVNPEKGGCIPSYHDERNYINGLLKIGSWAEFVCQPNQMTSLRNGCRSFNEVRQLD